MGAAKPKVFISHVRSDADLAARLTRELSTLGLEVWTDSSIAPGDRWAESIEESLERANLVLLLISPSFLASPSANFEAGVALGRKLPHRRILPVMLKGVTPEVLPYQLRRIQGVVAPDLATDVPTLIKQLSPALDSLGPPAPQPA